MLNKKNIFGLIGVFLLSQGAVMKVFAGRGGEVSSSTTPTAGAPAPAKTTIIPIMPPPVIDPHSFSDAEDDFSQDKSILLSLLSGGGGIAATGIGSLAMMIIPALITKKLTESSYFNKVPPNSSILFPSNNTREDHERFSNILLKEFEDLRESKKLGLFRTAKGKEEKENREQVLLNQLEQEVAKTQVNIYSTQRKHWEKYPKDLEDFPLVHEKEIKNEKNTEENKENISENNVQVTEETKNIPESEKMMKNKREQIENQRAIAGKLELYYLSVAKGKPNTKLLEHPAVHQEVLKNKKVFAEKIISMPTIYKNLSEKTRKALHEHAKAEGRIDRPIVERRNELPKVK